MIAEQISLGHRYPRLKKRIHSLNRTGYALRDFVISYPDRPNKRNVVNYSSVTIQTMYRVLLTGLIYCCLLSGIPAIAQYKFEKAVWLNKDNGLPENLSGPICKGGDGFLWIASGDGLCRFDGYQAKVFSEGGPPERSLLNNAIQTLLPVKDEIWVGTWQGISVMNTKDETFRHYQLGAKGKTDAIERRIDQNISALFKDSSGNIWIGTTDRGVAMYDASRDNFRLFTLPPGKYPALSPALGSYNGVLSITASVNNDSVIWAGTTGGLQKINKYTGTTELYTFPRPEKDYQVALNAFRRLYHHRDGLLYVGSWGAGVNVFNPQDNTFTPLEVKSESGRNVLKTVIVNIFGKSDHELWISTLHGLAVYDIWEKDIVWYRQNNPEKNEIYQVGYTDESNRVWLTFTYNRGLGYFDPVMQQFSTYSFKHLSKPDWAFTFYILSDPAGKKLTICPRVTDGIYFFDKEKKEWSKETFSGGRNFFAEMDAVRGFVELSPGEYLIASDKGVFRYSMRSKKMVLAGKDFPFTPNRRGDMIKDSKGNIWLSDETWGLTKWTPSTGRIVNYQAQTMDKDSAGNTSRVLFQYEDSHGNIWFHRNGGIGVYVASRDTIISFLFRKNEKNSFPSSTGFAEDRKGRVWVNSIDGWIGYALAANPAQGVVFKMNIRDKGIPEKFIQITADTKGNIWGYTTKELVRISPDDLALTRYSFKYGAGDPDFYHFSFLPTGEMILGGRNAITIANPEEFQRNTELPVPYLSEIHVLNQPFAFTRNGQPLRLSPRQNFFSIAFSAKAYTMARDVKFRYRLKGFDEWSEPTQRRFANYTNVPGGDYVFQLQAANNEGVWNPQLFELPVHIATSFWKTWWFRTLALLLLGGIVYTVYRYRVNQFRKKEKLKSEYEKKIANVEMSSLLAQMNPHFLFNSLNSIDSYIIRNESGKASEYLNNFARLMRLILQNSRSNYITLKDELEALELYMQMEGLRFKNKFDYSIRVNDGLDTSGIVIPPMLIQPFVENAIWHGLMHKNEGEKGLVEIIITADNNKLKCVVQDNGIGRQKAEELKVGKSANRKRSMGMQITRDRIEMINKLYGTNTKVEITDLVDQEGRPKGTRVELTIPY